METVEIILINYFLVAMVKALIAGVLTRTIYNIKFNMKNTVLFIISSTMILGTIVNFEDLILTGYSYDFLMILKTFFTFFTGVVLLKVFYKISYVKSVIAYGMFYITLGIGNNIVYAISSFGGFTFIDIKSSIPMQIFAHITINAVNILIVLLIKYFKLVFTLPNDIRLKAYWINVSYIVFAFIVIAVSNIFFIGYSSVISSLTFIVNVFLMIGFLIFSIININTFFKLESKSKELEYQMFYNGSLDILMNDLRRVKHNYGNMLAVFGGYIKVKKWDQLERYFFEVCGDLNSIDSLTNITSLHIKNAGLLGLIMSKLEYAKELGVKLRIVNTDEVSEINIRISELCEVLGILLDNAIEAAGESDNKLVELVIMNREGIVSFKVENTINQEIRVKDIFEEGYSTKGDGRGLGLWILKKIVNKHKNVVLNTQTTDIRFKQELIIS